MSKNIFDDVLTQLDTRYRIRFPRFDEPKAYFCGARLTAYSDGKHWALHFERLLWATRSTEYNRIRTAVALYGNPLRSQPASEQSFYFASEGPEGPNFPFIFGEDLNAEIGSILLRNRLVRFNLNQDSLREANIELARKPDVSGPDLLRLLAKDHRDMLFLLPREHANLLLGTLPRILQLEQWRHPDVAAHQKPSESTTFRLIAEAIANGDGSRYQPTESSNTDWRLWPSSGRL